MKNPVISDMKFAITVDACEFILTHNNLFYSIDKEKRAWQAHKEYRPGLLTFNELIEFLYTETSLPIVVSYTQVQEED